MTQLSREKLEEIAGMRVKETSNGYKHAPDAYSNVRSAEIVEMARRLLAAEAQEPVAYISKADLDAGYPHILARKDFSKSCPMAVYSAPQPVAVPGERCPRSVYEVIYQECGGFVECSANAETIWSACRAAMLNAEPVSQPYKLPSELLAAMEEVLRISDRDHEAWHRARDGIAAYRAAASNRQAGLYSCL